MSFKIWKRNEKGEREIIEIPLNEDFDKLKKDVDKDAINKRFNTVAQEVKYIRALIEIINKKLEDIEKPEPASRPANESEILIVKFKEYVREGLTDDQISKKFKEIELIEIASYYGEMWTTKGTKKDKVKNLRLIVR